jgi:hypothetical protein
MVRHSFATARECDGHRLAIDPGCIMASWGSFAWGFFAGLLVGEVTLVFFLNLVRHGSSGEIIESPPLAAGHETPAGQQSARVNAA